MRRIKLKPMAPPLSELRAVLRIDVPMNFDPRHYAEQDPQNCMIGKRPENVLEDAIEQLAYLDQHMVDWYEMIDTPEATAEIVLVDRNNEIWSDIEGEPDKDESRPTLFD